MSVNCCEREHPVVWSPDTLFPQTVTLLFNLFHTKSKNFRISVQQPKVQSFSQIKALLTWEHSEDGSKGIELEAVDDIAKVTHLYGHEDASSGKEEDVQALRYNAQPQHSYGENWSWKRNSKEEGRHIHVVGVGMNTVEGMMEWL